MTSFPPQFAVHVSDVPAVPVAPGITRRDFVTTEALRGWILDFAPGSRWPEVDHHAAEERYFVLEGSIVEGDTTYPAGSYVVFPAGSRHQPHSEVGARILGTNVVPTAQGPR